MTDGRQGPDSRGGIAFGLAAYGLYAPLNAELLLKKAGGA